MLVGLGGFWGERESKGDNVGEGLFVWSKGVAYRFCRQRGDDVVH